MSSSDLSSLSSAPSSDHEAPPKKTSHGIMMDFLARGAKESSRAPQKQEASPPRAKREPSPPHQYALADNPDIAFIVMFRSRFSSVFPKSLPHYGPQDLEKGVVGSQPSEQVESLLCALLGLVLNRKKLVERGHYQRALEDAVQIHTSQWPPEWEKKNPLHGGNTFNNMAPTERLTLLKTLILWSLSSSEAVQALIKESYKQARHDDDRNQPLSVQPWGQDSEKRRYWLIEGQDDTCFRLYRESAAKLKKNTWWSVAGDIPELKSIGDQLGEDGPAGRQMKEKIGLAIPRFEATEEKRKRREYRVARKAQFTRPEPGFSMYEGRTRGKKIRYTYSSDEGEGSDDVRSTRRTGRSGIATPAEPEGPTFTASGRQVKSRVGGAYGETTLSGRNGGQAIKNTTNGLDTPEEQTADFATGRPRRSGNKQDNAWKDPGEHIEGYNSVDEMEDEEDAASSASDDYGADDDEDVNINSGSEAEEDASEDEESPMEGIETESPADDKQMMVQLKYPHRPSLSGDASDRPLINGAQADTKPLMESSVVVNGQKSPTRTDQSNSITKK